MLKILHAPAAQPSLPLDKTGFTGDPVADAALAVVTKMVGGRVVALGANGATLADGDPANALHALGFLINDAAGYPYENKPAIASGKVAYVPVASGAMIETDQWVSGLTFTQGQSVYVGTGGSVGLLTNVSPAAGVGASGDLQSIIVITAEAGSNGNRYTFTLVDDADNPAAPYITRVGDVFNINIDSGVSTQTQVANALAALPEIATAVPDSGGTGVTVAGDATDTVTLSGGYDGAKPIGTVEGSADASQPNLRVHLVPTA